MWLITNPSLSFRELNNSEVYASLIPLLSSERLVRRDAYDDAVVPASNAHELKIEFGIYFRSNAIKYYLFQKEWNPYV